MQRTQCGLACLLIGRTTGVHFLIRSSNKSKQIKSSDINVTDEECQNIIQWIQATCIKLFLEHLEVQVSKYEPIKVGGTRGVTARAAPNNTKTVTAVFNYFLFLLQILFSYSKAFKMALISCTYRRLSNEQGRSRGWSCGCRNTRSHQRPRTTNMHYKSLLPARHQRATSLNTLDTDIRHLFREVLDCKALPDCHIILRYLLTMFK